MAAASASATGLLPRSQDKRRDEEEVDESDEEEVESDDEGSEAASLADFCDPDAGSYEDPTFDPDADGDLEVEAVLWSRISRLSISASARKDSCRKGSAVPKMGKEEIDLLAMVDKLIQDGQLEKLKVYECKSYLRMHKLRLTGTKDVLLNRIREHIEVKNAGEVKYPVSSFVFNCKGDACKGDVVMFEQNIYRRKKGAPREVKGYLCGQRTNAGRIIKESYGTAKQQHTFTIEILWSKGYKPWPPLHPLLIKGRNLYKDKTMRQPWPDEEERNRVLQEKHQRGSVARKSRAVRIHEKEIEKMMRSNRIKANKSKEQQNVSGKSSQEDLPQQMVKSMNIVHQRTDETKGLLSLQSGEPGNTRQQHIYSKATPTQHNEVLAQKGAAKTFKPELIDHPIPSIQHGGLQQQIFLKPTHTQQSLKDSQQGPSYQHQDEVLPQERAMRTSQKEFIDHQAPSQHNGGSENTRQYQISSKPTPSQQKFKYPQQAPKHQNHNEVLPRDDVKRSHRGELFDHQNNSYRATEYVEPAYQARGKFTQHANAYGASNYHQNAWADHQGHQPLRSRNRDFNSRDKFYGQDYHQQDYQFYGQDYHHHVQYRSQQNQQQSHYDGRQTTRQYHTQQNHYQNYNYGSRSNQKQYHNQQNQPQRFPVQRPQLQPCDFYYRNGWCGFGENCRYSHDL